MHPSLKSVCPVVKPPDVTTAAIGVAHVVSGTVVVAYAAATGLICVVSGTAIAVRTIVDGTTRDAAVGVARVLSGIVAATSCIRRLSGVSAPTGADDRGVMALGEGGAACPSSSDDLDSTTCHL